MAVLPGGTGSIGTGGAGNTGCPAATPRVWTGLSVTAGFEPRTRVKCYAEHPGAHSLTVVRLDTGEIIRTFRRDDDEVPTLKALTPSRVIEAPLDSPITGQPVAYPADVGAVADRVFVGDADGRLWKVDLSKPDPSDWKMNLFFDAFPNGEKLTNGPTSGQPIQTPPVISVDELGNITVALSTGDQDSGGTVTDLTNYVWSLTEAISTNRRELHDPGELVQASPQRRARDRCDGPVLERALLLDLQGPGTTEVCSSGTSNVYGMHYLLPQEETDGDDGGAVTTAFGGAQFATAADLAGVSEDDQVQPIVFGVTVAQLPSCIADQTGAEDDWLGLGQHSTITNVNPGKFQLLMQAGTTGQEIKGATTKTITMDLQTPPSFSSVDSWTAILE